MFAIYFFELSILSLSVWEANSWSHTDICVDSLLDWFSPDADGRCRVPQEEKVYVFSWIEVNVGLGGESMNVGSHAHHTDLTSIPRLPSTEVEFLWTPPPQRVVLMLSKHFLIFIQLQTTAEVCSSLDFAVRSILYLPCSAIPQEWLASRLCFLGFT
jgi:hypothetical protein